MRRQRHGREHSLFVIFLPHPHTLAHTHQYEMTLQMLCGATRWCRYRAAALASFDPLAIRSSAQPSTGTPVTMAACGIASDQRVQHWEKEPNLSSPGLGTDSFTIRLKLHPTLCIAGGGEGTRLSLANCSSAANQMFTEKQFAGNGSDVSGGGGCACWNVIDGQARSTPRKVDGYGVQCFSCVDSGTAGFNPNQRFTFSADGTIQAWKGYAPGYCVTATAGAPPPSPPAPGPRAWYLGEDYTDRHGSFLQHGGQWYYASNDRSHSGDVGNPGVFRDTVMCYIHFRANGTMEPCVIDGTGVGTYNAAGRAVIEAENFFRLTVYIYTHK